MTDLRGRYPEFDVLAKWDAADWDDQTRRVVRERLERVPSFRFFDAAEAALLEAVLERIIPQPDRSPADRVPIAPWIDAKLFDDLRDGYRYEELPAQQQSWKLALHGIDELALAAHGRVFTALAIAEQDRVLERVQRGDVTGNAWNHVPARRFFRDVLCASAAKIYYAHPAAWNECGYNGPSSPRGHVRKWIGGVDPWEAHERHTLWDTA